MNNFGNFSPAVAALMMVVASAQVGLTIGRFVPAPGFMAGWPVWLTLLVLSVVSYAVAELLQRTLFPERRSAFAFVFFGLGIIISLVRPFF